MVLLWRQLGQPVCADVRSSSPAAQEPVVNPYKPADSWKAPGWVAGWLGTAWLLPSGLQQLQAGLVPLAAGSAFLKPVASYCSAWHDQLRLDSSMSS